MLAPWKIQFCCLEATQSMIFCHSSLNSLRHKCFILSVLSKMSKALIMSQSNMPGNLSYELFKLAPKHPNKGVTQQQVKPKHTTRICSHMCSDRAHTPWNPANQESNLGKMLGIWALPYWNEDDHMVYVLELLWRWNVKHLYNQIETIDPHVPIWKSDGRCFQNKVFFFFF